MCIRDRNYDVVSGSAGQSIDDTTNLDQTEQSNPDIVDLNTTDVVITHVNGLVIPSGTVHVAPGDEITFKIGLTVPSGDVESLMFTNYLPNPLFLSSPCTDTFDGSAVPALNQWSFGVNDPGLADTDVTVSCSSSDNSILSLIHI